MAPKTLRPEKPYPEFPLFAHPNGQWSKKILGRPWYFGTWDNPDSALRLYLDQIDDIRAGRNPNRQSLNGGSINMADMLNNFLVAKRDQSQNGEISVRHFQDYKRSCTVVLEFFGRRLAVSSLTTADFSSLRQAFPKTWGPTKIGNEIQRMRAAFKWAAESDLIDREPKYGPGFKKPSRSVVRRAKGERQSICQCAG